MEKYNNGNYVGAPFNFVPVYKDVVEVDREQMETHGKLADELLIGEISYSVKAESPIFIADGKKDGTEDVSRFVRNEYGVPVIPGSSMRGLIRSNAQVLGLASFDDDIDDYNLMYRNVAAGAEKETYNKTYLGADTVTIGNNRSVSILTNVKAGYIAKKEKEYVIYMTDVDKISSNLKEMNYYVLSERDIAGDMGKGSHSFPYFEKHPECLEHIMEDGFDLKVTNGRRHYKGLLQEKYKENYYPISYDVANLRNITAVGDPGQYPKEGYLVCSGHMQEKKAKYIIPQINKEKEFITIPKEDIEAYQIDYNRKKNTLRGNKSFFDLPGDGEVKPVFYIYLEGRLYFGFTPRLRLFYQYKIKDGLLQNKTEFDYAKSLFGTIQNKTGYKSKVSFTDAVLEGDARTGQESKVILGEPKPTSYLDYLKQTDGTTTYNTDGFELRGIKQYWLHTEIKKYKYKVDNEKVYSHIRPLERGSVFRGKVRFQNLTGAELGLLLWSINLEENSLMNIGKAKAMGFGVIDVTDVTLKLFDTPKAYNLDQMLDFHPFTDKDITGYIDAYKMEVNAKIKEGNIEKLKSIQTFFKMHNRNLIPDNKTTRYMSIDDKEYQARVRDNIPLPSVEDVIKQSRERTGAKSTEKKELASGSINPGEVRGYQGKKVKFFVEGNYITAAVEHIKGISDLNKKNMKEKLPVGTRVSVKRLDSDGNTLYEVVILD